MLCVLREKLLVQATKLAEVSRLYRLEGHRFVAEYFAWLEEAGNDLSALRAPISILVQAERSSVASVLDGYLPDHVREGKSVRRSQKAAAAQSLEKMAREMHSKIESIDQVLDQFSEKLCPAVAVLATKQPDMYAKLGVSQQDADSVWRMLGKMPETVPTYNYFCARLASVDIDYLLMDILQKIVSNGGGGP